MADDEGNLDFPVIYAIGREGKAWTSLPADPTEAADLRVVFEQIIKTVSNSPAGSKWAIGTELNLVKRLAQQHQDKQIVFLDKSVCYCSTMNRIDLPHLVWSMESLVEGRVVNEIKVPERTAHYARIALDRMLSLI